ncbi:hypothetical protein vBSlqSZDD2_62 [Serratia phage vB_SlqS_ZDD2]|nr:hypothetical protein vBSlqSZDD2_62 [Serratia phage vB_SlqS_ZDD2]
MASNKEIIPWAEARATARYHWIELENDYRKRGDSPVEDTEQQDAFQWADYNYPQVKIWHTVNEGDMKPQYRQKKQRHGLMAGVSDLLAFTELSKYKLGAFEIKRQARRDSKLDRRQHDYLNYVADNGGFAALCFGAPAFQVAYKSFLR